MCKKIKTKQEINVCGEYALLFREHACHGTHFKSEDNFEIESLLFLCGFQESVNRHAYQGSASITAELAYYHFFLKKYIDYYC